MSTARRVFATATAALAIVAVPGVAWAKFTGATSASLRASSHTVGAPSNVTAADCPSDAKADRYVTVSWTPSADALVTGYKVTLTNTSDPTDQPTGTVPAGSSPHVQVQVSHKAAYNVSVVATLGNWTSAPVAARGPANC